MLKVEMERLGRVYFDLSLTGFDDIELGNMFLDGEDLTEPDSSTKEIDTDEYETPCIHPNVDSNLMTNKPDCAWNLVDLEAIKKNGVKVMKTLACGGGSSMGHKRAGCTILQQTILILRWRVLQAQPESAE